MGFEFLRVDRTGTGSEKWAVVPEHIRKSGSIPLSLADMEVATAPAIIEAMETVSYTHLDVYKRQFLYGCSHIQNIVCRSLFL